MTVLAVSGDSRRNTLSGGESPTARACTPGTHFRWIFRVWRPGLWLFDTAHYRVGVGQDEKVASIHDVIVNGETAKAMH